MHIVMFIRLATWHNDGVMMVCQQRPPPSLYTIMCVEFHSHLIKCIVFCWIVCALAICSNKPTTVGFILRPTLPRSQLALCVAKLHKERIFNSNISFPAAIVPVVICLSILFLVFFSRFESVKQCCAIYSNILKLLFVMTVQCSFTWSSFPCPAIRFVLLLSCLLSRPPVPSKIMLFVEFGY